MPRRSAVCLVLVLVLALAGCQTRARIDPPPPPTTAAERLDLAMASGTRFLLSQQSPDGGFRSDTYATFRDGTALTPLAMEALLGLPASEETDAACARGADYLAGLVRPNGSIDYGSGPNYPVYSASLAVTVLSRSAYGKHHKARNAWLADLRRRQLTEDLGWQPADAPYGGWGYCPLLPEKPKPGAFAPPFVESNLSATLYALEALRAAGCSASDPAWSKALVFVQRCQNYAADPKMAEPTFDDGGFFFIYDDPVRNKAGLAGQDAAGRTRFHSYGSTTADGLRALLLCGLKLEDSRVAAARRWLVTNFDAAKPPGTYAPEREIDRPAIYYYYCASASRALRVLDHDEIDPKTGMRKGAKWAEALADELLKRQHPDGSWSNPYHVYREDDAMAATCLALIALENCRQALAAKAH